MNRPSFAQGVGVALIAALGAGAGYAGLGLFVAPGVNARLVITGLAFGYVLYLLALGQCRVGRVTLMALWSLLTAGAWLGGLSLPLFILVQAGLVWLARSLYHQAGWLAALLDLGLTALGLGAAVWALGHSGSLALACWSFFLVQALFVLIPPELGARRRAAQDPDPFEQAYRGAEAALRSLASRP